jgi:hypothetical protein
MITILEEVKENPTYRLGRHNRSYRSTSWWVMLVRMDSTSIKPRQATLMYGAVKPAVTYLYRLRERMERRGFPPNDKLLKLTDAAYKAVHALAVELHYMGCESGVGRPTKR